MRRTLRAMAFGGAAVLCLSVLVEAQAAAAVPACGSEIRFPQGTPVVLDGVFGEAEWAGSEVCELAPGTQLLTRRSGAGC